MSRNCYDIDINFREKCQEDSDCDDEGSSHAGSLAVECIGRQDNSDVFVLGPELQFKKNGEPIPACEQRFVWIPYLLKKLKVLESIDPLVAIPTVKNPMKKLVRGLQNICGDNFGSALFLLGVFSYIMHVFRQDVLCSKKSHTFPSLYTIDHVYIVILLQLQVEL